MQTEHHRGIKWQFVFDCIPETEISPQPDRFLCRWPHPHRQSRKTSLTVSLPSVDNSPGAPRTPYDIRVFKHCGKVNADKKHLLPNCFSQIPLPVNLRPRIQFDNYKNRQLSSLQRKTNIIRCLFQSVFKTNSLALSNLCWHKTIQVMLANSNTWWLLFGATTKTTWEDLCSCVPTFLYAGLTSLKPVQTVIFTGMQFISHPGYTFQSQPINHDFPDNALPLIRRWP